MSKITYTDKVAVNTNAEIPDINKVNAADMNEVKTVVNGLDDLRIADELNITNLQTGWNNPSETWEYVSVDDPTGVIKVNADVTTKYSLGMRIKFTNGGNVIYGILTKIGTYGGDAAGYTYLTFLHEIDPADKLALYLMANSAITVNFYSTMKAPFGFPSNSSKWTIKIQLSNDISGIAGQTSKTLTTLTIPIGVWNISTSGYSTWYTSNSAAFDGRIGLHTSQNAEPNGIGLSVSIIDTTTSAGIMRVNSGVQYLDYAVTSKTSLYWNIFQYSPNEVYRGTTSGLCWIKSAYL